MHSNQSAWLSLLETKTKQLERERTSFSPLPRLCKSNPIKAALFQLQSCRATQKKNLNPDWLWFSIIFHWHLSISFYSTSTKKSQKRSAKVRFWIKIALLCCDLSNDDDGGDGGGVGICTHLRTVPNSVSVSFINLRCPSTPTLKGIEHQGYESRGM